MAKSDNLRIARQAKQDEFYTKLADIENELKHYKSDFLNKIVFCNCDDPFESNFFKYFAMNFNRLGLKKLICTSYATSPVAWTQLSLFENENVILKTEKGKQPYKIEITEVKDYNGDGAVDLADVEYLLKNKKNSLSVLNGDGDFRSEECIALLKQSDIVVTNPPFSLFREYVAQLIDYNKKFIIIGNQNAIAYKEIFPLIRDEKVYDPKKLEEQIVKLMQDDDVTKRSGIYEYLLSGNEKFLNIRAFTENEKRQVYERQDGVCPMCVVERREKTHYEIKEMEADHITPWRDGGKTDISNCQMLCREHNRIKSCK